MRNTTFMKMDKNMREKSLLRYREALKIKENEVFDQTRRKWLKITKEEIVRQLSIEYLKGQYGIPYARMKTEVSLRYNQLEKRADILVYDRNGEVLLLAECKSFDLRLDRNVIEQILMYYSELRSKILMVTNGVEVSFYEGKNGELHAMDEEEMGRILK